MTTVTVTRAVKHKVAMGNYEGIETFASVSMDVPYDSDMETVRADLDGIIDVLVRGDLDEAARTTAEKKTYVQYWKQGD